MPTPEKQHLQGRSVTPFRREWAACGSPRGPAERQRRRTGWGGLGASVESGQSWGVQAGGAESQRQPIVAGKGLGGFPGKGASFGKQAPVVPASRTLHMLFPPPAIFASPTTRFERLPLFTLSSSLAQMLHPPESLANLFPLLGLWGLLWLPWPSVQTHALEAVLARVLGPAGHRQPLSGTPLGICPALHVGPA